LASFTLTHVIIDRSPNNHWVNQVARDWGGFQWNAVHDVVGCQTDGAPYGTRTRVSAVKGRRPGPLDEGRWKRAEV
jgi:hypothetical protein